jgi:hypothetical protein
VTASDSAKARGSSRFRPLAAGLLAALLAAGCAASADPPVRIAHVVLLRLADPAEAAALLAECDAAIPAIPAVADYLGGTHLETGRDLVRGDYDVGLYLGFTTAADYDAYVDHPAHQALLARWRERLSSITVYDVARPQP